MKEKTTGLQLKKCQFPMGKLVSRYDEKLGLLELGVNSLWAR